ncbi:hypothetical protein CDL12_13249 [Handroanthus impetiginosus]|uniref:Uncharacterized protein n=1 Tax=Handroanthus impetiginosus TaxID=429701 RepID=A0A2G9HA06_9LAMI|nr:hypothetical protein CDL12_13249 [Handroanthus impetiginosus]
MYLINEISNKMSIPSCYFRHVFNKIDGLAEFSAFWKIGGDVLRRFLHILRHLFNYVDYYLRRLHGSFNSICLYVFN